MRQVYASSDIVRPQRYFFKDDNVARSCLSLIYTKIDSTIHFVRLTKKKVCDENLSFNTIKFVNGFV